MIIELFILLEVLMIGTFFTAFFSKQEIIWAVSSVLSGILMITSYNVQLGTYVFDSNLGAYVFELTSQSFPFMMGINMLFFVLALVLGIFDIYDKYGISLGKFKGKSQ